LPPGAQFVSASSSGVYDNVNEEIVWTLTDTLFATDACRTFESMGTYPNNDPDNQTGLSTQIPKVNTATFDAKAVD